MEDTVTAVKCRLHKLSAVVEFAVVRIRHGPEDDPSNFKKVGTDTGKKEWKDVGKGVLKLMKHKEKGTHRIVLRNEQGKVMLNAMIGKSVENGGKGETKFEKIGGKTSAIKFMANDAIVGMGSFMVKVGAANLDDLHAKLEGAAKGGGGK